MNLTIEKLVQGDEELLNYYKKALENWENILVKEVEEENGELSELLSEEQEIFEEECGGRDLGQEIMAIVGIYQFYSASSGFGENVDKAMMVYKALQESDCSEEIKIISEEAAKKTGLQSRAG